MLRLKDLSLLPETATRAYLIQAFDKEIHLRDDRSNLLLSFVDMEQIRGAQKI